MTSVLLMRYGAALLAWLAVAYKLPALRRHPREPAVWMSWCCFLVVAVVLTVTLPAVSRAIDRLAGVPSLTWLLADGVSLLGWWCLLAYLYALAAPDARHQRLLRHTAVAVLGVLLVMIALFFATPVHPASLDLAHLPQRDERAWPKVGYQVLYLGCVGLAAGYAIHLLQRYTMVVRDALLRLRLRLFTLSLCLGLGYVCSEVARAIILRAGEPVPIAYLEFPTIAVVFTGVALATAAVTMPLWGSRLGIAPLARWVDDYSAHRQLYPLWRALYRANPEIAYLPPPSSALADALAVADLEFRLCRRVIEIRDGIVKLRAYRVPQAGQLANERCQAASVPSREVPLVVAAASIAAALQVQARGDHPGDTAAPWDLPGGADLRSEIETLVRVAAHYQHSPHVRAVPERLDHERQAPSVAVRAQDDQPANPVR